MVEEQAHQYYELIVGMYEHDEIDQREYDALEGVTAEDPEVRHGTTGWIDYL